jgi:hypothetical protein
MNIIKWFFTSSSELRFGDFSCSTTPLFQLIILIVILFAFINVYKDSKARGKNGLVTVVLMLLAFPFSFLLWYWLRPEEIDKKSQQKDARDAVPSPQI